MAPGVAAVAFHPCALSSCASNGPRQSRSRLNMRRMDLSREPALRTKEPAAAAVVSKNE
jgi:hypothetical protein